MSKDGTDRPKTGTLSYASRQDVRLLLDDLDRIVEELEKRQRALAYTPSVSPVDPGKAWISSHYGVRISPFTGKKQFHLGVDVAGWKGTPIMATAKGEVISVKKQKLLGLVVKLEHDKTFSTIYGHLLRAAVKKGERVERGQIIGYMGNSGRSTGYHVHYGVKKNDRYVNPIGYMMDWDDKKALFAEKR
jgi:murein DD-endopeptidase MepM/ murein hydrolase activator NlpD